MGRMWVPDNLTAESGERNDAVTRHCGKAAAIGPLSRRNTGTLLRGSRRIERGGIHVLLQQHRQVLGYGVSEVRTEHADVIAASVTHSHYGLRSQLVSDADARSKCRVSVVNVAVQADIAEAGDADGAGSVEIHNVGESAVSFGIHGLREVDFPAQTIVDGQLGSCAPGVLTVKEPALLALGCVVRGSDVRIVDVTREGGDLAEQE